MFNIICIALFFLLLVGGPFIIASRHCLVFFWIKKAKKLESELDAILTRGQKAEIAVNNHIKKLITRVPNLRDARTMDGDIVILNGANKLSQEIDHIIVTKFAVIIVETKDWCGKVGALDEKTVALVQNGRVEHRKSPYAQARAKQQTLSKLLGEDVQISFVVVFTNPVSEIGRGLPSNFIRISQLENWLEHTRQHYEGRKEINVNEVCQKIDSSRDRGEFSKCHHMVRIARLTNSPSEDALRVYDLDTQISDLYLKADDNDYKGTVKERIQYRLQMTGYYLLLLFFLLLLGNSIQTSLP